MSNTSFDSLVILAGVVWCSGFLYYIKKTLWIIQRNILDIQGNTLEKINENLKAIESRQLDNFIVQKDTLKKVREILEKIPGKY